MPILILFCFIAGEIWLLLTLIERFGAVLVLAWVILSGVLGIWLIRRTGLKVVRRIQMSAAQGELPAAPMLADLLLLIAGLLFLMPGIVFDLVAVSVLASAGLRGRLATKLQAGMAQARPDLRTPVLLEGEYREITDRER